MKTILKTGLLCVLLALFAGVASANTLTYDGVNFDLSTSGNTITLQVTDVSNGCETFFSVSHCYLGNVAVKTFSSFDSIASSTQPSDYSTAFMGNIENCNVPHPASGYVCWNATNGVLLGSTPTVFTATVTNPGAAATFHVQADLFSGTPLEFGGRDHNNLDQISQDVTGTSPPRVPEPASLAMLGTGLSAIALRLRRK